MSDLSEIAAAPSIRTLRVGEQDCALSPLSVGELAEFATWAEGRRLRLLLSTMKLITPEDQLSNMIAEVAAKGEPLRVFEIGEAIQTPEGMARSVWMSVRKRHPKVLERQVAALGFRELLAASQEVLILSGVLERVRPEAVADPTADEPLVSGNPSTGES